MSKSKRQIYNIGWLAMITFVLLMLVIVAGFFNAGTLNDKIKVLQNENLSDVLARDGLALSCEEYFVDLTTVFTFRCIRPFVGSSYWKSVQTSDRKPVWVGCDDDEFIDYDSANVSFFNVTSGDCARWEIVNS